jgi:heme a synthase
MTVNFTLHPSSDPSLSRTSDLRSSPHESPSTVQSHVQAQIQTRMSQGIYALAIAVVGLMALGSATRVMNAGLSCPDWPLCYGQVLPQAQMNLQVFLEWFHRLVATSIGLGTIALLSLALWFRAQLPKWLPWTLGGALLLVVWQGVLGALTVTQLLRFDIVTAHLGTGLLFFVTLLTIATCLIPTSQTLNRVILPTKLWKVGAIAMALIYGQSLLGGLVATRWALHQCFGQQQLCNVMNNHLMGVVPATLSVITLVVLALKTTELPKALRSLVHTMGLILMSQVLLGYATFRLHLQVEPLTVMHQVIGALLLGSIALFTVLAYRLSRRATGLAMVQATGEPEPQH